MVYRKLLVTSLNEALKGMTPGETTIAPEGYSEQSIRRACTLLKPQGFIFATSTQTGSLTITRLK